MDGRALAAEARRLRCEEQLSVRQLRGCLIVRVPKSRELYWHIEGLLAGMGEVRAGGCSASPS